MELVKPIDIRTRYSSSNAAYLNPLWATGNSYSIGDKVDHLFNTYQAVQNIPASSPESELYDPLHWTDLGANNKYAMFDNQVSTQTTGTTQLDITIRPQDAVNTVSLLNIVGSSAEITVYDTPGGSIIYHDVQSLQGDVVLDWYQYFFYDYNTQRTQTVWRDIPLYQTCEINIKINSVGPVAVGYVVAGVSSNLGLTSYGLSAGIIDYSKKETDPVYGTTTFLERAFKKRMSCNVYVHTPDLNRVSRTLANNRATPSLWIGAVDPLYEETTVVFGFFREFNIEIPSPGYSLCSLDIEGLI